MAGSILHKWSDLQLVVCLLDPSGEQGAQRMKGAGASWCQDCGQIVTWEGSGGNWGAKTGLG